MVAAPTGPRSTGNFEGRPRMVKAQPMLPGRDERVEDEAGTAPEDRRFRPDVQGMRAIAILLVVLYHAHVPGFGGGYVGVDVFFVISGFVITGLLLRERSSTGSTSIRAFYGRRARRIIPAATVVIVVIVVLSYPVLGSFAGNRTADDGAWSAVFLANFHFANAGNNYLASLGPPSLLQNYWSLAVEEQFYLVYPTVFLVVGAFSRPRLLRRNLAIVLGTCGIASFVVSVMQTSTNPTVAYFSPVPRAWELALGGLVAVGTTSLRRLPVPFAASLSWMGLGLVVGAAVGFSNGTPYPGAAVAIPVLGAAGIIAGGVTVTSHGAERLLGVRALQGIGLISYSWYLWHWPVLTIAAQRSQNGSLSILASLWWVAFSLGLAVVTYLLVENPIRHSRWLASRRWASLVLALTLVASTLVVTRTDIRLHNSTATAVSSIAELSTGSRCPPPTPQQISALRGHGQGDASHAVSRVLVVGDSTACTLLPGLTALGDRLGVQVENGAVIGCGVVSGQIAPRFVDGRNLSAPTQRCPTEALDSETSALRRGPPDVVLWSSSWERSDFMAGSGPNQRVLRAGTAAWRDELWRRLDQRVQLFTNAGATVVLLTQPPFVQLVGRQIVSPDDENFLRLNSLLEAFAHQTPHVFVVNMASRICPGGPPCSLFVGGLAPRGDGIHFVPEGSLWTAEWLLPRIGVHTLDRPIYQLPAIRIAVPGAGSTIRGTQNLAAEAPYRFGVGRVEFYLTGGNVHDVPIGRGPLTRYGWVYSWNTRDVPNGNYRIHAVADDTTGDHSTSPSVPVKVANQ